MRSEPSPKTAPVSLFFARPRSREEERMKSVSMQAGPSSGSLPRMRNAGGGEQAESYRPVGFRISTRELSNGAGSAVSSFFWFSGASFKLNPAFSTGQKRVLYLNLQSYLPVGNLVQSLLTARLRRREIGPSHQAA